MSDYKNTGIFNPNRYKRPGTKMPDFNGKAQIDCPCCQKTSEFELALWDRGKYTTIAFTEKSVAEKRRAEAKAKKAGLPTEAQAANQAEVPEPEPKGETDNVPF